MKLYEYEGKKIFQDCGIKIPSNQIVESESDVSKIADRLQYPVFVKSQILSGGRKKSGGVKKASNEKELLQSIQDIFSTNFNDEPIQKVLVEGSLEIEKEIYAGITVDHISSMPLLLFSMYGGIEIEELAANSPEYLFQMNLEPNKVYYLYDMMDFLSGCDVDNIIKRDIAQTLLKLISVYFTYDCITAEINPLCLTSGNDLYAADSKMEIDDSALFRHPEIESFEARDHTLSELELAAKRQGIAYIRLGKGNIGLIAGGAGLGMATMDMISHFGGQPANFLDLGGNATQEKTAGALRLVLETPGIQGVLINVFGGINNCYEMARGVIEVYDSMEPWQSMVVKMRGHSQKEGWDLLEKRGIPLVKYGTTSDAVKILMDSLKE